MIRPEFKTGIKCPKLFSSTLQNVMKLLFYCHNIKHIFKGLGNGHTVGLLVGAGGGEANGGERTGKFDHHR